MTHGGAVMQNVKAEVMTMDTFEPNADRPWWVSYDERSTAPIANLGFKYANDNQRRWYRSATSMQEMLWFVKQRTLPAPTGMPPGYNSLQLEFARRNGRAQGFCIDPHFAPQRYKSHGNIREPISMIAVPVQVQVVVPRPY